MEQSMAEVEAVLGYKFRCRVLLEQALTHSSFTDSVSYERLEFMGDVALNLVLTNYLFLAFPNLDPGSMTALRSANVSTEKFARVAVRHRLYCHLRRHASGLDSKVKEFADSIKENEAIEAVKAPKVLADIVESIAGAVYVDSDFNLKLLWTVFRGLLEPIVTPDTLKSNPLSELYNLCQKAGTRPDFKYRIKGTKNICNVYIGGQLVGMGCSEHKDIAKLSAAKNALEKLARIPSETGVEKRTRLQPVGMGCSEEKDIAKLNAAKNALEKLARNPSETGVKKRTRLQLVGMGCNEQKDIAKLSAVKNALEKLARNPSETGVKKRARLVECSQVVEEKKEPANSKHKLSVFCSKKHLPPPNYSVEKEIGPNHGKSFMCSVQVQTLMGPMIEYGVPKTRVKDAQNSAACLMLSRIESLEDCEIWMEVSSQPLSFRTC